MNYICASVSIGLLNGSSQGAEAIEGGAHAVNGGGIGAVIDECDCERQAQSFGWHGLFPQERKNK